MNNTNEPTASPTNNPAASSDRPTTPTPEWISIYIITWFIFYVFIRRRVWIYQCLMLIVWNIDLACKCDMCWVNLAYMSYLLFFAKIFASFAITCILRSECEYIFAISSTSEAKANISSRVQIKRNEAKRSTSNNEWVFSYSQSMIQFMVERTLSLFVWNIPCGRLIETYRSHMLLLLRVPQHPWKSKRCVSCPLYSLYYCGPNKCGRLGGLWNRQWPLELS